MVTFSIITATFNPGPLLERTIASLRSQHCKDFEWIIVDGASTDDSLERIRLAGELVTVCISEPDNGIADAWNKGLARVNGSHVCILNAGDTYDADFLNTVKNNLDGQHIVCSHARVISGDGHQARLFRAEPHKLDRAMHVPHNWCAVPAHHYRTIGPYHNMPLAMDFEWFHRYYKRFGSAGFRVIDQALGTYYLGGKSDKGYIDSFRANESIIVENGGNRLLAQFYRAAYTVKHTIKCRVLRSS